MISMIRKAFRGNANISSVIQIFNQSIFCFDDANGISKALTSSANLREQHIKIEADFSVQGSLYFIPLDGVGGLIGNKKTCCDFFVSNEDSYILCEMKFNAFSSDSFTQSGNITKAVSQINNTIDLFKSKQCDFFSQKDTKGKAVIALPVIFPRVNPTIQNERVKFLTERRLQLEVVFDKEVVKI